MSELSKVILHINVYLNFISFKMCIILMLLSWKIRPLQMPLFYFGISVYRKLQNKIPDLFLTSMLI